MSLEPSRDKTVFVNSNYALNSMLDKVSNLALHSLLTYIPHPNCHKRSLL